MKWENSRNTDATKTDSEIEYLNRPVTSEEMAFIILKLPTKKNPGPIGFSVELTKYLKRN